MNFPLQKLTPLARMVWVSLGLVYLSVQWARHGGQIPLWVDWYLTDFICLPLVLGLALMVQRMNGRDLSWTLPRWHGLAGVLIYAIYFESILPRFSPGAVGDLRDAASYFLGWLLFEFLLNRAQKKAVSEMSRLSFSASPYS